MIGVKMIEFFNLHLLYIHIYEVENISPIHFTSTKWEKPDL